MSDEFDEQASAIAIEIADWALDDRIAAACRGSGNPAALAWLAENLGFDATTRVADIGAGLGGPAEWFADRYGCQVIAFEPARRAADAAASLFDLQVVVAHADRLPIAHEAFDAALCLGLLSVVKHPTAVLREAARVSAQLGILDYCSTIDVAVDAGGSWFPSQQHLVDLVADAGWHVGQCSSMTVAAPRRWAAAADAVDVDTDPAEQEVVDTIGSGAIAPFMIVASRW